MGIEKRTLKTDGYEEVVVGKDASRGMHGIIAIHNSNLGPACGGVRMIDYRDEADALDDVLRLSKGMSYKSALAGIGFGGGKSVLIGDPKRKTPAMLEAFGDFVGSFEGRYIAAKDMNIGNSDLATMKSRTRHVLGVEGEPGTSGDPSPVTARGIFRAIEATCEFLFGNKSLKGKRVALQGVGHVGFPLAQHLREAGAQLWVTDIDQTAVHRAVSMLGATAVSTDAIYEVPCDFFSPNARGAVLNPATIPALNCRAVVGGANNQLASAADGEELQKRGILYAPDFAVNAGGIINIFVEYEGYSAERALKMADGIYGTMKEIFRRHKATGDLPYQIADRLAEERIREGK